MVWRVTGSKRSAAVALIVRAGTSPSPPISSRLPLRLLGQGDPKITFLVGAVLTFPGVSYLDALDHIHRLNPGTAATVALVVFFCVMQQVLLEVPLVGYVFAPDRTQGTANRFRAWKSTNHVRSASRRSAVLRPAVGQKPYTIVRRPDPLLASARRWG